MASKASEPWGRQEGSSCFSPWSLKHLIKSQEPRTRHLTGKLRPQACTLAASGGERGNPVPSLLPCLNHPDTDGELGVRSLKGVSSEPENDK